MEALPTQQFTTILTGLGALIPAWIVCDMKPIYKPYKRNMTEVNSLQKAHSCVGVAALTEPSNFTR